jgi:hypothetical protein
MSACIYITDPDWLNALRGQKYPEVIFWRGGDNDIHLENGSAFYFKVYDTNFIAGRAQFLREEVLSIPAAWAKYKFANGVNSEDELRLKANDVLRLPDGVPIRCLLLCNVCILRAAQYFPVNEHEWTPGQFPYRLLEDHRMRRIRDEFRRRWEV